MEVTGGKGVDVVLDCTSGAGTAPVLLGIDALKRRAGTLLIQGEMAAFPDFPVKKVTEKAITIKSARGHSYRACELAVKQLASGRFPLDLLATHTFGLSDVDRAIKAIGGAGEDEDVIHVSLLPVGGVTVAGTVIRTIARADPAVADAFAELGVATAHEAQGRRGLLSPSLNPIYPGAQISGTAVTVSVPPGDNWMIHVAVEQLPGG